LLIQNLSAINSNLHQIFSVIGAINELLTVISRSIRREIFLRIQDLSPTCRGIRDDRWFCRGVRDDRWFCRGVRDDRWFFSRCLVVEMARVIDIAAPSRLNSRCCSVIIHLDVFNRSSKITISMYEKTAVYMYSSQPVSAAGLVSAHSWAA